MQESIVEHVAAFGEPGRYTYLVGLSIADARAIGPTDIAWSFLSQVRKGDMVRIRGTDRLLKVIKTMGTILILDSYGDGSAEAFLEVHPRWGSWAGGMISVHKAHVIVENCSARGTLGPGLVVESDT